MSEDTEALDITFWAKRLPTKFKKLDDDSKHTLVLSLLSYLDVTSLKFFEFFFTSENQDARIRAGTFMAYDSRKKDEGRRFAPAVLYKAWHDKFPSARPHLHSMIHGCAKEIALQESNSIIEDRTLKISSKTVNEDTFDKILSPGVLVRSYKEHAPFMWSLLEVFSSSPNAYRRRKVRKANEAQAKGGKPTTEEEAEEVDDEIDSEDDGEWLADPETSGLGEQILNTELEVVFAGGQATPPGFSRNPMFAILMAISMTTFARNRATNALPMLLGLFFKVEGASSRVMKMLSNTAVCVSTRTTERVKEQASVSAIEHAVTLVRSGDLFLTVADNINLYLRKYQQRLTNHNSMIHATNSAIVRVNSDGINVKKAMNAKTKQDLRGQRKNGTFADISPNKDDSGFMNKALPAHIANLIAQYTPGRRKWHNRQDILEKVRQAMPYEKPIPVEKTDTKPFGVFDVNEGSKKGLLELIDQIRERTGMTEEEWAAEVRILGGDWLTSNNFRHARRDRADDQTAYHRLENVQEQSQLFHFALHSIACSCTQDPIVSKEDARD